MKVQWQVKVALIAGINTQAPHDGNAIVREFSLVNKNNEHVHRQMQSLCRHDENNLSRINFCLKLFSAMKVIEIDRAL